MRRELPPEEGAKLDLISSLVEDLRSDFGHPKEPFHSKVAGAITKYIGSWHFIIFQAIFIFGWMFFNKTATSPLDKAPYEVLSLLIAIEAAFILPIILLSQNRSEERDRRELRQAHRTIDHVELLINTVIKKMESEED